VPVKIEWWKRKTIEACNGAFVDYYGLSNFLPGDTTKYIADRMNQIDGSKEGQLSSREEDIGDPHD